VTPEPFTSLIVLFGLQRNPAAVSGGRLPAVGGNRHLPLCLCQGLWAQLVWKALYSWCARSHGECKKAHIKLLEWSLLVVYTPTMVSAKSSQIKLLDWSLLVVCTPTMVSAKRAQIKLLDCSRAVCEWALHVMDCYVCTCLLAWSNAWCNHTGHWTALEEP